MTVADEYEAARERLTPSQRTLLDACEALAVDRTPMEVLGDYATGPYRAQWGDLLAVKRFLETVHDGGEN